MEIAQNTFFAAIGPQSVVLDLPRDRYFGLGPKLTSLVRELLSLPAISEANEKRRAEIYATLLEHGVISSVGPHAALLSTNNGQCAPTSTLWPAGRFGMGNREPRLTSSALFSLAAAQYSLSRRTFIGTIEWLKRRKLRRKPTRISRPLEDFVDAYHAARPWFPVVPICRLDAFAISRFLWAHGLDAELVFGVRLAPFAAHCWVQLDDVAISEPFDRLKQFTEIMRI